MTLLIKKKGILEYINYYNHDRIKLSLKGMSPIQYRAHHFKTNFNSYKLLGSV